MHDLIHAARYHFGSRGGLAMMAAVAILAGMAFNWNWLVAIGVAPILLAALPCAVMCGLGLCFGKLSGGSSSSEQIRPKIVEQRSSELPSLPTRSAPVSPLPDCCQSTEAAVPAQPQTQPEQDRSNSHA